MAHAEIEEWFATVAGVPLNPDKSYGNQCVDYVDAYAEAIFGVPWTVCVGGVIGAKQLLDAAPDKYWIRVDNDPTDPNLLPPRGAIVVTSGDDLNEWGHTYGVERADKAGCDVMQQDGFAPPLQFVNGNYYSAKPAHRARMPWAARGIGTTLGWLIPRENMIIDTGARTRGYGDPLPVVLAPYQRLAGKAAVGLRKAPSVKGDLIKWLDPEKVYDFKGYVRREKVNGTDIWLVGAYSDGFASASGFEGDPTKGLKDLTAVLFPPPAPAAKNTRVTGVDGVNRRKAADKNADLIDAFPAGVELTLGGYVIGTDPYGKGNKTWFVGGISGGYMHSSGFTSQSTEGLTQLALPTAPVTPTAPVKPTAYDFIADLDWVEKIPANLTNLELGKAPKKDAPTVIHQMGRVGVDTIGSTINEFQRQGSFKSTHFCVSKKRGVQMVSLKDRAYHAGPLGNDYIGIETDPLQDEETIATVRRILLDLKALGYKTVYLRHREIPGQATECGSLIDLERYKIVDLVVPAPPVKPTAPVGPSEDQVQSVLDWLKDNWRGALRAAV